MTIAALLDRSLNYVSVPLSTLKIINNPKSLAGKYTAWETIYYISLYDKSSYMPYKCYLEM